MMELSLLVAKASPTQVRGCSVLQDSCYHNRADQAPDENVPSSLFHEKAPELRFMFAS